MAGTVIADKWENGNGTENYKCRAWVNFNGTGTVAIRSSGNVSSITDLGTGNYTVNFTTAMTDANYAAAIHHHSGVSTDAFCINGSSAPTSSGYNINVKNVGAVGLDATYILASFFR